MRSIPFVKMHGAGNDYILIAEEDLHEGIDLNDLALKMSNRHTGAGSDGIIIVRRSQNAAARMEMYNSDGSASAMCGNGLRLVAKFAAERGMATKDIFQIESGAGFHRVELERTGNNITGASVEIGMPVFGAEEIPVAAPLELSDANRDASGLVTVSVQFQSAKHRGYCLSLGNPHCVIFIENVAAIPLRECGPALENDARFPLRTNVEFAQIINSARIRERTWERGAGETMSCGSGACATAIAAIAVGRAKSPVAIEQTGGTLEVAWSRGEKVILRGPAAAVFSGVWPGA
ncbi:MAG: diaminopimelate epimerase [Planctomycetes bacterium]|nr:diaminopimelate epimerase [Planctomycetota bacterium]